MNRPIGQLLRDFSQIAEHESNIGAQVVDPNNRIGWVLSIGLTADLEDPNIRFMQTNLTIQAVVVYHNDEWHVDGFMRTKIWDLDDLVALDELLHDSDTDPDQDKLELGIWHDYNSEQRQEDK